MLQRELTKQEKDFILAIEDYQQTLINKYSAEGRDVREIFHLVTEDPTLLTLRKMLCESLECTTMPTYTVINGELGYESRYN